MFLFHIWQILIYFVWNGRKYVSWWGSRSSSSQTAYQKGSVLPKNIQQFSLINDGSKNAKLNWFIKKQARALRPPPTHSKPLSEAFSALPTYLWTNTKLLIERGNWERERERERERMIGIKINLETFSAKLILLTANYLTVTDERRC